MRDEDSDDYPIAPVPILAPTTPGPVYSLQAVVRHEGSTSFSGHYKSCVRGTVTADLSANSRPDVAWREHNDARVSVISEASVLKECETAAYMLFYTAKP